MKQVFPFAVVTVLVLPLLGCSRKNDPPAPPGNQSGPNKELRSSKKSIENGLLVMRERYESANKYTPDYAARLVEEFDKLKRADADLGPKTFWDKYGMKTVVEVEGQIEHIAESNSPMDHRVSQFEKDNPYILVLLHVRLKGWPSSKGKDNDPGKAELNFAGASQNVRALKKGQSVIVRGSLGGYFPKQEPGSNPTQHPSGGPRLHLCQLVSPKDE